TEKTQQPPAPQPIEEAQQQQAPQPAEKQQPQEAQATQQKETTGIILLFILIPDLLYHY
ncbi:unnamed protein product, partial [Rotaria sp. Silwood2]